MSDGGPGQARDQRWHLLSTNRDGSQARRELAEPAGQPGSDLQPGSGSPREPGVELDARPGSWAGPLGRPDSAEQAAWPRHSAPGFGSAPGARFGPRPWPDGPAETRAGSTADIRRQAGADPGARMARSPDGPADTLAGSTADIQRHQAGADPGAHVVRLPAPSAVGASGPRAADRAGGRLDFHRSGTGRPTGDSGQAAVPPRDSGQPGERRQDAGPLRQKKASGRKARRIPAGTGGLPGPGSRAARSSARARRRRVRVLILSAVAVVAVAAGAVAAMLIASRAVARSHVLAAPPRLGSFVRRPELEHQMNARQLQHQVIAKSAGQASHVVSAVYENSAGGSGAASSQIMLFIGGNLTGVSPTGFMTSFTAQFSGAHATGAGSLGGRAACVHAKRSVAMCAWADGDTFGVLVSPTMSLPQLASEMRAIRPAVERPAR